MTEKATVMFKLDSSLKDWTKFTSPAVVAAGFKCFLSGEYIGCGAEHITHLKDGSYDYNINDAKFAVRNAVIHCAPVQGKKTSIWSCEAKGEIVAFAEWENPANKTSATMTQSKHWSHDFTFHNPDSVAVEIDFHKEFAVGSMYYIEINGEKMYCKLQLRVTMSSHTKVDLCAPDNKMLKSPEDAAQVLVEGETLWLSKEVLGDASPYFQAYFNNDFKEKREGEFPLTDVKLEEFMRFVAIIYGVHVDLDKTSLQDLLRLEDLYQCEAVRSKCHAFLVATDTLTLQEKLRIGDRFRFEDVIDKAIEKIDVDELMAVGRQMEIQTHTHKTTLKILKAVSERR